MTEHSVPESSWDYAHKHKPVRRKKAERGKPPRHYVQSGCTCGWIGAEADGFTKREVSAQWNEHLRASLADRQALAS